MRIRRLLIGLMVMFLFTGTSFAISLLNKVPAVSGQVTDATGAPIAGASITVKFFGSNNMRMTYDKDFYVVEEFTATTDDNGVYKLESTTINLLHPMAKLMMAEVYFKAEGCKPRMILLSNMRMPVPAVGVFLIELIKAHGAHEGSGPEFFSNVSQAYNEMIESKFSNTYRTFFEEAMSLQKLDNKTVQTEQFGKLYK